MRALIIGQEEKQKLQALVAHAEKNIFSIDDLLDTFNKELSPAGELAGFVCDIPNGYKVVFSINRTPAGNLRHLSVSVDTPGRMPSPESVEMIMKEIGFENGMMNCKLWLEDIGENHKAINIVEPIK